MGMFEVPTNFRRWQEVDKSSKDEDARESPTLMVTISVSIMQVLKQATSYLVATYKRVNSEYHYDPSQKPARCITDPSEPAYNDGFDNIENEYILNINDLLISPEQQKYVILDFLGKGTFGQVVKCRKVGGELCAAKVIKNKPAYFFQGLIEVKILDKVNRELDPEDDSHLVRMLDFFVFRNHLIIIFELLSYNLFDILKENRFRGFSMPLIRILTQQILKGLNLLSSGGIIHCDLKPENILLKQYHTYSNNANIKIIDFGSACFENSTIYTYIQSRYYRAPEVLIGLPYGGDIDIWSLGCICAELYIGIPLFPGNSEYDQLARIIELLEYSLHRPPTQRMIEQSKHKDKFFKLTDDIYTFKTREEYERDENIQLPPSKKWIDIKQLDDLKLLYPLKKGNEEEKKKGKNHSEMERRDCFIDFLKGLLKINPSERWSSEQAFQHQFVMNIPWNGIFEPGEKKYKEVSIPTGSLRQGSCPSLLERIRGGSQSSASSVAEICYRPHVNELPDEFFKGFVLGRLADFTQTQKKPAQENVQISMQPNPFMNMAFPPYDTMQSSYMPEGVLMDPYTFQVPMPFWRPPPDIRGPRHAKLRPRSYGNEGQSKNYDSTKPKKKELPRPQSPKIDDERQDLTPSAKKFSKKNFSHFPPPTERKPRSSSFNQEQYDYKPKVGTHKKACSSDVGEVQQKKTPISPTSDSRILTTGPIEPSFIPPLTLSTPRHKASMTGSKGEGGYLDKIAKEARQKE